MNARCLPRLQQAARDERGSILIIVTLLLPVLVGLAILVVDAGRLFNLDTELQNNVDALALAGAAELDRRPDAHIRACQAMKNLLRNRQRFADGDGWLDVKCQTNGEPASDSDVEWKWLKSLPPDDCSLAAAGTGRCFFEFSSDPATTFYIHVKSRRSAADFTMLFPASFINAAAPASLSRSAVSGMSQAVCRPTPLMICNPWETAGIDTVPELRTKIGTITDAREYGAGGPTIGSGQFGLLNPAGVVSSCGEANDSTNSIVEELKWELAGASQASCKTRNGLCPKTGVVATLDNAVNTRFDIYSGPFQNLVKSNPNSFYPAARTIWHSLDMSKLGCDTLTHKETTDPTTWVDLWYPRSNGWDRAAYFKANGYDKLDASLGLNTTMITLPDGRQKTLGTLTRYETYLWEVSRGYTKPVANTCFAHEVSSGQTLLNGLGLEGRKARRDIFAPIVNCGEVKAAIDQGVPYSFNGNSTQVPLPYVAIARFFITEPVNRTYSTDGAPSRGTTGQYAWPATCPTYNTSSWAAFALPLGSAIPIEAGRTYFLRRPTTGTEYFETTIATETASPTIATVASGFADAAALLGKSGNYVFCGVNTTHTPNTLFIATNEATNESNKQMYLYVNNIDFQKRIWLELEDVFASDNGGDVTRDIVKLYR